MGTASMAMISGCSLIACPWKAKSRTRVASRATIENGPMRAQGALEKRLAVTTQTLAGELGDRQRQDDVHHHRQKQRLPGHGNRRYAKQQGDDRSEGEDHHQIVERDLGEREVGVAPAQIAPHENHRRARRGAKQDQAGDVAVDLRCGQERRENVADEYPAEQRHGERLDGPVHEQRDADAVLLAAQLMQRGEVDLHQHRDDHHPDQQPDREVDLRDLQAADGLRQFGSGDANDRSGNDAQEHPKRQPALEETHWPGHRQCARTQPGGGAAVGDRQASGNGIYRSPCAAGLQISGWPPQQLSVRKPIRASMRRMSAWQRTKRPSCTVLTRPAWVNVFKWKDSVGAGKLQLLGNEPHGQAGRGVLDEQAEDGETVSEEREMTIKVGINGFGRMGRLALRAAWDYPELEVVHINEANGPVESAAHLLEFDSVQGRWQRDISVSNGHMLVDGKSISYSSAKDVAGGPWSETGVDIVLEASGKWRTVGQLSPYLAAGVKKVIVAAPVKDGDVLNVVMGVNDHLYDPARDQIVTAASCTTNCLAPVVKVVHEAIGITRGMITTIHSSTNTQSVHDQMHKDLRRARAASLSLVPTTTGSATAIALIFPELKGKLDGHAVRVPLLNASLTDCVFEMKRPTTAAEVNACSRQLLKAR
jgi:glyceraldehyde 3-phosphate dehydrogenase